MATAKSSRSTGRKAATKKAAPARRRAQVSDEPDLPSVEERKGMRGHDDDGNVRPADGRWDLHKPADESDVCRTGD